MTEMNVPYENSRATRPGRAPGARSRRQSPLPWLFACCLVLVLTACSAGKEDPILRLSAQESLDQGKVLLGEEKYRAAKEYLVHAFEVEPNSAAGREGLLLAADALFLLGGFDQWVESERRYRDFINRFPTSPRADYAQFRAAQSLSRRMEKPSRDQEVTRKAYSAFEDLIRLYPTSQYIPQAREEMKQVRQLLAEHEWVVAFYYFRASGGGKRARRLAGPAIARMEYLLENYPDYEQKDKIYSYLCRAHARLEQPEKAAEACSTLRETFPDSDYLSKLPKHLRNLQAPTEAVESEAAAAATDASGQAR